MLAVPMFDMKGKRTGELEIDPAALGDRVRPLLIKQAIVAFLDHQRQDSARTKSRSDVKGSSRKLYRQKGTGRARVGNVRNPVRRGGGRTFAKRGPRACRVLPKKMRRLACNSAILAKIQANEVMVLEGISCPEPKTKVLVETLQALGVDRGCVLATNKYDKNLYLSGRNISKTDVRLVGDLSAYEVLRRQKLVFTRPAFEHLKGNSAAEGEAEA